jgi:serine/threonine protein kinase
VTAPRAVAEPAGKFAKAPGAEPVPGIRLLELLGKSALGEVWRGEDQQGQPKAVKFVAGPLHPFSSDPSQPELQALQHVRSVSHPYLLSVEHVEVIGGELVIVMELRERNLAMVLAELQAAGKPGLPRDELLSQLREAAEVLDFMNFQHGLEHLDVRPRNLFLHEGHIQVADFGLVQSLGQRNGALGAGISALYAAPEIFNGRNSRTSDQYSLAITYQELLTGTFPIQGKNARQLMLNHVTVEPNLEALPSSDRAVLARALAKDPDQRFSSCLEFINSLTEGNSPRSGVSKIGLDAVQQNPGLFQNPGPEETTVLVRSFPDEPPDLIREETNGKIPAKDAIPGYKLLECLATNPLGDIWRVQAPDGRRRLAKILNTLGDQGATLAARLQQLRHPALPLMDILRSPSGRIYLVFDAVDQSFLDRYQECRRDGLPGIPRHELLQHLSQAAAALEDLWQRSSLPHLTLNPRNLWLHEDKVVLFEFGLVSLLGLPQPAGPFNGRYAAPELFEKGTGQKADQFSLALIYAELLTGLHPRPSRAASRLSGARNQTKFNLDLLPAFDRPIIAKALHHDPRQRFASCLELVRALEQAGQVKSASKDHVVTLPSRLPLAALLGETGPSGSVWPSDEYVKRWILLETGAEQIASTQELQYLVKPGNIVEHRCPIRMIPGGLNLKLHDFPKQWQAMPLRQDDNAFICRIPASRTIWQRCFGRASGMEIQVLLESPGQATSQLVEAIICVKPYGAVNARLNAQINEIGPALIDSVRNYLQAEASQRGHVRWPCSSPVHVYPVLPDLQVGARTEGTARDISLSGLCLRLSQAPASDHIYVNLPAFPTLAASAVLVNILRQRPAAGGGYEVAGAFASADPARPPTVAKS